MKKHWFLGVFLLGMVIRIGIMPWAGSYFSNDLFIPFLDSSLRNIGTNPWDHVEPKSFPYGLILYLVLVGPKALGFWLFGDAALGAGPIGMMLFKFPILVFDTLLFWVLVRNFHVDRVRLLLFYWLNPIIIYVNYAMGHIDIIPMALITFSIILLCRKELIWSAVFAAFATGSKFHTIIALPLILLFIWRNEFWPRVLVRSAIWVGTWVLISIFSMWLPYRAGLLGYITTASPEAMRLFSFSVLLSNDTRFYFGFAFVLLVMGRLLVTKRLTEQGLFNGVGMLFTSLLLVTDPFASWYLWLVPFCPVFTAQYRLVHILLPVTHIALYFAYFVILPATQAGNTFISGICLTLLQGTVAANLALMWFFVVKKEFPLSGRLRPFVIGIAGDSGSGKSRLADSLSKVFDVRRNSYVEGDDYHKWERGHQNWSSITHLSPRANFLDTMSTHTLTLSSGRAVLQPHYDHNSGRFTQPRPYKPGQTIIVQGLHTLYPKTMREIMDLKVFISPHPNVRLAWKIKRDRDERGHSLEKIMESMRRRQLDGEKYIEPQRAHADWIIEALPEDETDMDKIPPVIRMRHLFWNDLPINAFVDSLATVSTLKVELALLDNDIDRVALVVSGTIDAKEVGRIAENLFPFLRSLTSTFKRPKWDPDFDGINQLIALSLLNWKEIKETLQ